MPSFPFDQVNADAMSAFAEDASLDGLPTYTEPGGSPFPLSGAVFDDAFKRLVLLDDGTSAFLTSDPMIGVRLSLFAAEPVQGGLIAVPRIGKTFVIKAVEPDSHGWALLRLNFQGAPGGLNFQDPDESALAGN